jgi:long-chain acyl-CoA synthetase
MCILPSPSDFHMRNETLITLFERSASQFRNNILLWEKVDGTYKGATYGEVHDLVHTVAAGLLHLGIAPEDRCALISEGRNLWVVSELAILCSGAINVPLSIKLHEGIDLQFRLAHAQCRMAIVSATQAPKLRQIKAALPTLERTIMLDPMSRYDSDEVPFDELLRLGREFRSAHPDAVGTRAGSLRENHPATICYTSGTTADPKGVVLTHRNYTANVEQSSAMLPIPEWYCSLLILPWDHCFAHTAGIYTLMKNGASMASVQVGRTPMETLKNIPSNIRDTRPTFLLSVPTLAKNFRKNIEAGVRQKGKVVEALFHAGLAVAVRRNGNGWNRGKGMRAFYAPLHRLFDAIVFRKIRDNFGGRLEFFIGGGALLDIELQRFFYAIGIPMFQGYGLSESSPVISANVPRRHKLGSSGTVVPSLQLKICDEAGNTVPAGSQGEIVVKGENVMAGYWRNERATAETIRDGWLFTGDLGYCDDDGFLYVLGRTKSLLIANDGEKYSPEGIEETICSMSRFIDQMMLYNNQSPYTVALISPNKDALLYWLDSQGISPGTEQGQRAALQQLQSEIDAYRAGGERAGLFPERWLPSALAVLPEGFTEQNELLNSTLKIVRGRIVDVHRERIASLFTSEGKDVCNGGNREVIAAWRT